MERLWVGVICKCVYGNKEENGVIDNVKMRALTVLTGDVLLSL